MARSLFGLVGLGATLIFALPAAMLGLDYLLLRQQPVVGGGLILIAALMILVEEHITTPMDLPTMVADKTVGKIAGTDDEE
jgi:hypothetical protein